MTKADLINTIAATNDITAKLAGEVVDTIATQAAAALQSGNEFVLPGIGKLKTKTSAARTGRNPKTGESIEIAAKTSVKFAAAKALKDAVAG